MKRFLFALVALITFGSGTPALAHSALVFTTPKPNETLPTGPQHIKLTFSLPILEIGAQYEGGIQIADSTGSKVLPSCSVIDSTSLEGIYVFSKPGPYELTWRVVAADGHVVSSAYRFNVQASNSGTKDVSAVCSQFGLDESQNPLLTASAQKFSEPVSGVTVVQFVASFAAIALLVIASWSILTKFRARKKP
jgi:methionine-rich copper-binding protein CopC